MSDLAPPKTKEYKYEAIGVPVIGYDSDYFDSLEARDHWVDGYMSMSHLVTKTIGDEALPVGLPSAIGEEGLKKEDSWGWADSFNQQLVNDYRNETNRQYPPVYKIKIVCQIERLSDEEGAKVWEAKKQKCKEDYQEYLKKSNLDTPENINP